MCNEKILDMIMKISPQAKDFVRDEFENNNVIIYYFNEKSSDSGVFLAVENAAYCILFAYVLNDVSNNDILTLIEDKVSYHITNIKSKELCFNVYGRNYNIINLIRNSGFSLDGEGYHLNYVKDKVFECETRHLIEKGYESKDIKKCSDLFDAAYNQLDVENGWATNTYSKNKTAVDRKFIYLNKLNQIKTFWNNEELVGAYIIKDNYIIDFVVHPNYQNKGYGKYILAKCLKQMSLRLSPNEIKLRVIKSNTGAKRFYEANNFIEIACFAEHTYSSK